jgi:hypothetical protein
MKIKITEEQQMALDEAFLKPHAEGRVEARFKNIPLSQYERSQIYSNLDRVIAKDFSPNKVYAIKLADLDVPEEEGFVKGNCDIVSFIVNRRKMYFYEVMVDGKTTVGDEVWAVVVDNTIVTVYLSKSTHWEVKTPEQHFKADGHFDLT